MSQPQPDRRPRLSKVQALDLLGSHFGLVGDVASLPSERDQNFRVVSDRGDRFVLKIAHPDVPTALLDLQADALAFLAERDIGVDLPRIVPTTTGDSGFAAPGDDGATHWVRLLTYVEGEIMGSVRPRTPSLLESFGEAMGRLDAALSEFDHPAAVRPDFQWDLTRAHQVIDANLSHIRKKERGARVEAVRGASSTTTPTTTTFSSVLPHRREERSSDSWTSGTLSKARPCVTWP